MSASRCLWSESHCRENLLLVLGVDAAQKVRRLGSGGSQALLAVVTRPSKITGGEERFMLAHVLATSACGGPVPCFWACSEMKGVTETVGVDRKQRTSNRKLLL